MPRELLLGLYKILSTLILAMTLVHAASAEKEKVLYSFIGGSDGGDPFAGLTSDKAGNLFGTTFYGGGYFGGPCGSVGCGTVFMLDKAGHETVLYGFTGGSDGAFPQSPPIVDAQGNLYGTASVGGDLQCIGGGGQGCGTVFKLTHSSSGWQETVLYSFKGGSHDGAFSWEGVVMDQAGNLYGTTEFGGAHGHGTLFSLTHANGRWKESVLINFGAGPLADVVLDSAGNLYGAVGEIFKLTRSKTRWKKTVLACCSAGALILDKAGNLYGTGFNSRGCCGNVFQLTHSNGHWNPTVLYTFKGGSADGDLPFGLALDKAGNVFGTTAQGGGTGCNGVGCGTIFKLTRAQSGWTEAVLHRFTGGSDGGTPFWNGGLVIDKLDNLYGTTSSGGHSGCSQGTCGVVFKLTP